MDVSFSQFSILQTSPSNVVRNASPFVLKARSVARIGRSLLGGKMRERVVNGGFSCGWWFSTE